MVSWFLIIIIIAVCICDQIGVNTIDYALLKRVFLFLQYRLHSEKYMFVVFITLKLISIMTVVITRYSFFGLRENMALTISFSHKARCLNLVNFETNF